MNFNIETLPTFLLGGATFSRTVDTWEFPILAKYRLPLPVIKPYIDAGPAFRAVSASLQNHMSGTGFSTGVGIEACIGRLRIAPEVRYTHWGSDGADNTAYHAVSVPNQLEFLAGLATAPAASGTAPPASARFSKYLSLGVTGGLPFSNAFIVDEFAKITYPSTGCGFSGYPACPVAAIPNVQTYRASRNYLVGPMIEVHLPLNISIEGSALYSPLSLTSASIGGLLGFVLPAIETFSSWQFPVVGKYKFRTPIVSPYLDAGPTFRAASSPLSHYLANAGVTAGVGIDATAWRVHICAGSALRALGC